MASMIDLSAMTGATVNGGAGDRLGTVESIYVDSYTGRPEWAAVRSDAHGAHVSLVPLTEGAWDRSTLVVPFDERALKSAPAHDPDAVISSTDEYQLYRHYGMTEQARMVGDRCRDVGTIRSEERSRTEAGRVRLRRHLGSDGAEGEVIHLIGVVPDRLGT